MKTHVRNLFLLPVLVAGFGLLSAGWATAQTFTNLHNFFGAPSEGNYPRTGVILLGSKLYGTTSAGGSSDRGTIFSINRGGEGFTNLHSFTTTTGYHPQTMIASGDTLYGTAPWGGSADNGTVFAIKTNGTGFTVLHHFEATAPGPDDPWNSPTNSEGANPFDLILAGNVLYGTATAGGSSGQGTVFKLNTNGSGFTTLHSFEAVVIGFPKTNSEGTYPSSLMISGNTLYGVALTGGSAGNGTLFAVNTDGTGFTTLHHFTQEVLGVINYTNSDGFHPGGKLVSSGNTLFGTAIEGGNSGFGTVFALNTNGSGFTILHHFTYPPGYPFTINNSDGANPVDGLILSGNTLFGMTTYGGSTGWGAIFAVNLDGNGFTTLHNFAAPSPSNTNSYGYNAAGGLILAGNTLYGTTRESGDLGYGAVFSLTLPAPPQLTIVPSGTSAVLRWPTNAFGFALQSATNLFSPTLWTTVSPAPVVVNGQNTVTNSIFGAQKFYRLNQ